MEWFFEPDAWVALVTLTTLELVLGIDNIVFLSILVAKLPARRQDAARRLGLGLAMGMRILLLLSLAWVVRLTAPLLTVAGRDVSGRDLVLIAGGLFLLAKSTQEIHQKLEGSAHHTSRRAGASFASVIIQILLLDVIFSLDSVITAVGMVEHVSIMIVAIVAAVLVMLVFAKPVGTFVERHPTIKILALSFLLLVGTALVADGVGQHIPRGYIYFAMGFSVFVEMINLRLRGMPTAPVRLHEAYVWEPLESR